MRVIKCRLQGGWCLYYTVLSLVSSMIWSGIECWTAGIIRFVSPPGG